LACQALALERLQYLDVKQPAFRFTPAWQHSLVLRFQPGSAGVSPVVLRVSRSTSEVVSNETSATARGTRALPLAHALRAPPVEPAFTKASAWQAIETENRKSEI
jgi:hypothetical protein